MSTLALAESLYKAGNPVGAMHILRDSVAPGPQRDLLMARCALKLGDLAGAIAGFANVLAQDRRHVEAAAALGALYVRQGWLDKAEAHYLAALKAVDSDRLRTDLALVLLRRGQPDRALAELGRVLAIQPANYPVLLQRALVLLGLNRVEAAATDLRRLVAEAPERDDAWGALGTAEFGCGNHDAAAAAFGEAYRRRPADTVLLKSLALALLMAGRIDESSAALQRLREMDVQRWQEVYESARKGRRVDDGGEIEPRPLFLLSAFHGQGECRWERRARFGQVLRDLVAHPGVANVIRLLHGSGIAPLAPTERLALSRLAADAAGAGVMPWSHTPGPAPDRLRVGYVLPQLGEHVVARILCNLLAAHDPAAVELHVIAVRNVEPESAGGVRARYGRLPGVTCHHFCALDDEEAATRLRAMAFDILVDLAVYNDSARPAIFARRPAPVQVNFLGAPYSSGAPWMDYVITDPVVSPAAGGWCTEAEARMPDCYFVYGHEDAAPPAVPPRSQLGLPDDRFIYSALNNPYKIDPSDLDCWARILAATPGSVLLLKGGDGPERNLRREAEQRGVDPARLLFASHLSPQDYLLRQGMPDLFLDTRYYGGHTTLAESLWMGVPALSCPGDSFQSRVGASLLASCRLQELIMPDRAAYEATAIALFHDRERLRRLAGQLAAARLQAAPFDMPGQARRLEKAFRHMRARFAQGLPAASFDIGTLGE